MGLRLAGIVVGAQIGVTAAVVGVVVAQAITTVSILAVGFSAPAGASRPPRPAPIGDDRGPIIRFVAQSAAYTGLISLRLWVAPLALGIVRSAAEVGPVPRRPDAADGARGAVLAAADDPALRADARLGARAARGRPRRDPPLRQGLGADRGGRARAGARVRFRGSIRLVLGADYLPAVPAARLILVAAAIQLVLELDEDVPGHDRPARPPALGARRRDRGDAAADRRARQIAGG